MAQLNLDGLQGHASNSGAKEGLEKKPTSLTFMFVRECLSNHFKYVFKSVLKRQSDTHKVTEQAPSEGETQQLKASELLLCSDR